MRRALAIAFVSLTVGACSSKTGDGFGSTGEAETSSTVRGNWSKLGGGQCLTAVQGFFPAMFGASVPIARDSWSGDCGRQGACHIWVDDIPSSSEWERHPIGTATPTTYDMIVFPPIQGNAYGHVAIVDHVENGKIFVMDANYNDDGAVSSLPHTVAWTAYGFYRLKSHPGGDPTGGSIGGGGGGAGCHSDTLAKDVAAGTCVQSDADGKYYECHGGVWDPVTKCSGASYWGDCWSAHLSKWLPPRACSRGSDGAWYQCGENATWVSGAANGSGPIGACNGVYY